jgi:hypothetical protein
VAWEGLFTTHAEQSSEGTSLIHCSSGCDGCIPADLRLGPEAVVSRKHRDVLDSQDSRWIDVSRSSTLVMSQLRASDDQLKTAVHGSGAGVSGAPRGGCLFWSWDHYSVPVLSGNVLFGW